jgi:predicted S18 family serine protease
MMLLLPAARCYAVAGPIADKSTMGPVGGILKNFDVG